MTDDRLKSLISRIEHLEEEKAAIANDIKEVYSEAKSAGYDVKAMRALVKLRKIDAKERAEQEAILDTYKQAMGMLEEVAAKPERGDGRVEPLKPDTTPFDPETGEVLDDYHARATAPIKEPSAQEMAAAEHRRMARVPDLSSCLSGLKQALAATT